MKTFLTCLALTAVTAIPAQAGHASNDAPTLTGFVASSGGDFDNNRYDYDVLLNAVLAVPGLADLLATPELGVTLLAPNDLAFIRLARDLGYDGTDEGGAFGYIAAALSAFPGGLEANLSAVLSYHVLPGDFGLFDLFFPKNVTTFGGTNLGIAFFRFYDQDPDVRNARLTFPFNVRLSNGRLQTISRVLLPLDVPN